MSRLLTLRSARPLALHSARSLVVRSSQLRSSTGAAPTLRRYLSQTPNKETIIDIPAAETLSETTTTAAPEGTNDVPQMDHAKLEELLREMERGSPEAVPAENQPPQPDFVEPPHVEQASGEKQQMTFQTETKQILDIMAKSLYTDKEVFLRELISNASDALEKARYLQSSNQAILEPERPFEIRLTLNEEKRTLTIQDSGIGMTKDELISHLGTIAKSGSKAFMKQLSDSTQQGQSPAEAMHNIIGQFGVGFYSTFMVADNVEVFTQSALEKNADQGHYWSSDGSGAYQISPASNVSRGTKVIIHLKKDSKEFSTKYSAEAIIKKYSNFVGFPIYLNGERLNTIGAIWLEPKDSISEEKYQDFYKYASNAYDTPLYRIHFSTDAPLAINALFYFPERHFEKFGMGRMDPGVSLYCRRVLIKSKSRLVLPEWLRFVKGVVDSEDIPLNISRETTQDSSLLRKVRDYLTKKIIRFLDEESRRDNDKYMKWYQEFGSFLKEGVCSAAEYQHDIAKLLRYESSMSDAKHVSLDEYIANMPPEQKSIYYCSAPNREVALSSPYYEGFKEKNIEVLFLYQPIDEFVVKNLDQYKKRKLVSIEQGDVEGQKEEATHDAHSADLITYLKKELAGKVSSIKVSRRVLSSPAIIVDHESSAIRKMMKYMEHSNPGMMNRDTLPKQKLEINPSHPVMRQLLNLKNSKPELAKLIIDQVYDNALIAADILDDPRMMLGRLNKILEQTANLGSPVADSTSS